MKIKKAFALQASYQLPLFTKIYFIFTTVAYLSDDLQ